MLKKIFLVVAALLLALAAYAAMLPSAFHITRTATISAPPAAVFSHVNDFHKWDAWSPWAKIDPAAKVTFEGPASGPGAIMNWSGNDEVGAGRMTLTESRAGEFVRIKVDFTRPYVGSNTSELTFKPAATGTSAAWTISGENGFIGRIVCLFMNMEKMLGGDIEKGLAQLKTVAEANK